MPTLASVADLAIYLDREFEPADPAALLALAFATATIQAETRQTLFFVENDTVTLPGGGSRLLLPERPVVGTPTVSGVASSLWRYAGGGVLEYGAPFPSNADDYTGRWPAQVQVTYSHGFAVIPDDLRAACCLLASGVLSRSDDGRTVQSETVGAYSVTFARTSEADDRAAVSSTLSRYRRSSRSALL